MIAQPGRNRFNPADAGSCPKSPHEGLPAIGSSAVQVDRNLRPRVKAGSRKPEAGSRKPGNGADQAKIQGAVASTNGDVERMARMIRAAPVEGLDSDGKGQLRAPRADVLAV